MPRAARVIRPAVLGHAAAMLAAWALTAAGIDHVVAVSALLFIGYGCLGLILPVSSVLALGAHSDIAGTASSLMGALQLALGALMVALSGTIADGTMTRMTAAIAACGALAVAIELGPAGRARGVGRARGG